MIVIANTHLGDGLCQGILRLGNSHCAKCSFSEIRHSYAVTHMLWCECGL